MKGLRSSSCVGALLALSMATHTLADEKDVRTYRWVDEKGVVHYGDRVPPQYSQSERSVLNGQGVEVRRIEAQKSPEQLALEAAREQTYQKQKQHDAFLLTTYTSVKDIEELRDVRIDQVRSQRLAAEQYRKTLTERLVGLQERAKLFRPYSPRKDARRMPDDLASDLIRTLNEMRVQEATQTSKTEEESALRAQFQADIDRYHELRVARSARSAQ